MALNISSQTADQAAPVLFADQAKLSEHTASPGAARTCGIAVKLAALAAAARRARSSAIRIASGRSS
jgi:hypothetical protein